MAGRRPTAVPIVISSDSDSDECPGLVATNTNNNCNYVWDDGLRSVKIEAVAAAEDDGGEISIVSDAVAPRREDSQEAKDSPEIAARGEPSKAPSKRPDDCKAAALAVAAQNVSNLICSLRTHSGLRVDKAGDDDVGIGEASDLLVPAGLPHEQHLEMLLRPEKLQTGPWLEKIPDFEEPSTDRRELPTDLLRQVACNQAVLRAQLDRVSTMLNLHSAAFIDMIMGLNDMRMLCLKEAQGRDGAYNSLKTSLRAIVVGADPDLKAVPFETAGQLEEFFQKRTRVQKLVFVLISYYDFGDDFAEEVLNATLAPELQQVVAWHPDRTSAGT